MTKREYRRKLWTQRAMGLALLIISIIIIIVVCNGNVNDPNTTDATAALVTLPAGIYAILTTKIFIL